MATPHEPSALKPRSPSETAALAPAAPPSDNPSVPPGPVALAPVDSHATNYQSLHQAGDPQATRYAAEPADLQATVYTPTDSTTAASPDGHLPRRFGGYELLEELGHGGMGVVYQARQTNLGRVVALKMILSGLHAGPSDLARFRTEGEAIARLQHPNIVQIHEVGEQGGLPFFSLEFCAGGSLKSKLNGTPLAPREAAALVEALARAMDAAHQKGVIHRDLKPANVLLAEDGTPKVTDFGLAKKLDEAGQTTSGAVMGTPSYMAPEQAGGKTGVIGPAVDVYALGAILYECLTGRPPFRAATALETLQQVLTEEPVAVRRLQPRTPRDLETICLKCLHKEAGKRYGSAAALAEDLRRFQAGEPIRARPVGALERVLKWVRRNPVVAGLGGAVAAALLLGAGVATLFAVKAESRARAAEWLTYTSQLALAQREWQDDDVGHARALLDACQMDLRGWEHAYLQHLCDNKAQTFKGHTGQVLSVCWSPDGQRLASASEDGTVKVWDADKGQEILTLKGHSGVVSSVAFSPDGQRLASASEDGTVKVWDADKGQEILTLKGHSGWVHNVAFSPDGKRLASASSDRTVKVWDAERGQEALSLKGHHDRVGGVCWSPDGQRLASASEDGTVKVWDAAGGGPALTLKATAGLVYSVCWSPDGTRLAGASSGGGVQVWDAVRGHEVLPGRGLGGAATSVCWSPNGKRLASADSDGTVKVWDAASGQETLALKGHTSTVWSVAFSPDGRRLASAGGELRNKAGEMKPGELNVWDTAGRQEARTLSGHTRHVRSVCWSPDGRRLASASWDKTVKVWDAASGQEALTLRGHTHAFNGVCWSPDGTSLAGASEDSVKVWDAARGREALTLGHTGQVLSVCWSPDGKRLASADSDGTVKVWDAASGQETLAFKGHAGFVHSVCWSPDGRRLASAGQGEDARTKQWRGEVKVWDAANGQEAFAFKGHTGFVRNVCWSPDGKRLASADTDGTVMAWEAARGKDSLTLKGHTRAVNAVCWSPDGKRLASASDDHTVKIWDAARGQEALTLKGHTRAVCGVCWSPDGKRLASASEDGTVKVWDSE